MNGEKYLDEICFGSNCKIVTVYDGTLVTQDNWLNNTASAYGILGFGPSSPLWSAFIDPSTDSSTYSIALAKPSS